MVDPRQRPRTDMAAVEPPTETQLDHLFVTDVGLFDVVPRLCGSFDELIETATTVRCDALELLVCDPRRVLSLVVDRTRKKDVARRHDYVELQSRLALGHCNIDAARLWLAESSTGQHARDQD